MLMKSTISYFKNTADVGIKHSMLPSGTYWPSNNFFQLSIRDNSMTWTIVIYKFVLMKWTSRKKSIITQSTTETEQVLLERTVKYGWHILCLIRPYFSKYTDRFKIYIFNQWDFFIFKYAQWNQVNMVHRPKAQYNT